MIKLQTYYYKDTPLSNFKLQKHTITVDGRIFDLSKIESITEDQESPVYRLGEDIIININIPKNRMFMFTNGNLLRFFDIDGNGIISVDELKVALDYILETDTEKVQAGLKIILDDYLKDHTKQEWWDKGFPVKAA
jgi:hypothetical protein